MKIMFNDEIHSNYLGGRLLINRDLNLISERIKPTIDSYIWRYTTKESREGLKCKVGTDKLCFYSFNSYKTCGRRLANRSIGTSYSLAEISEDGILYI